MLIYLAAIAQKENTKKQIKNAKVWESSASKHQFSLISYGYSWTQQQECYFLPMWYESFPQETICNPKS